MKGFFGGALFDPKRSPFGVAFTPCQCIHFALTRPGVSSILCGYDTAAQVDEAVSYEMASEEEKDYASVIASAPLHASKGQCTYCGHCVGCRGCEERCPFDVPVAERMEKAAELFGL